MAEEDPDSKNALTRKVLFSQNNRILKNLDPVFPQDILTVQNTKGEDQISIITIILPFPPKLKLTLLHFCRKRRKQATRKIFWDKMY